MSGLFLLSDVWIGGAPASPLFAVFWGIPCILEATSTRRIGYLAVPVGIVLEFTLLQTHHLSEAASTIGCIVISAGIGMAIGHLAPPPRTEVAHIQQPLGYAATGQPIYPIVGYTPDGQPVTADKVAGPITCYNMQTNSMATISLIMAFVFAPLAIVFGHIARSQIRRTGEQGAGLALAGLIIGYLSTAISIAAIIYVAVALNPTLLKPT